MRRLQICLVIVCGLFLALPAMAQDPAKVDPDHYKVEFENDHVRVLRITYGPHEKSVMHKHPAGVAVFLTDMNVKMNFPDGKSEEQPGKAGEAWWTEEETHLPENLGDEPFELVLVEMKSGMEWSHMSGTLECASPSQEHSLPVAGRPEHSYVVNQVKCTWTQPWLIGGVASKEGIGTGVEEHHGNWSHSSGTYVDTMANGDKAYYKYEFKTKIEDGMPHIAGHEWKLLGGTGMMKGAKGKGGCKATAQESGTVLYQCEGKYTLAE